MENNILSMLEFTHSIYKNEQLLFEQIIANDFQEANWLLNETDNSQKSFAEKAKETFQAIWDKIVELAKAFRRKLIEWCQLIRKKFYEITKADKKISEGLKKLSYEDDLVDWNPPKGLDTVLAFQMFMTDHKNNVMIGFYEDVVNANLRILDRIDQFKDDCNEVVKKSNDTNWTNDNSIKEGIDEKLKQCKKDIEEELEIFDINELVDDIKSKNKSYASKENIERDMKICYSVLYGEKTTNISKMMLDQYEKILKNLDRRLSTQYYIMKKNAENEQSKDITLYQARALKEILEMYYNRLSRLIHNLGTLYMKAYADIRKYALSAIHYAEKHGFIVDDLEDIDDAPEPALEWAIMEASDEFVYNFFAA